MKRVLTAAALALAVSMALSAAPVACEQQTTLADLIALSGPDGGCISQDKLFNNFSYTGGGGVTAADVSASLIFTPGPESHDIHGWLFNPTGGAAAWTTGFTLAYDISITGDDVGSLGIVAAKDQINSGLTPNGTVMTDEQTPNIGSPFTIVTSGATSETTTVPISAATAIHTVSTVTFANSSDLLASYEQQWFQAEGPAIPEPYSLSLIGGGLVLLGLRKFRGK